MKIIVNGITRDMTPEEEAEWEREHKDLPPYPKGAFDADKAEAYDILMGVEE